MHTSPFPLTFTRGQSTYLHDADGHTYVDFLGEYTAGIYGHSHPVIRKAIESALDRGWNYGGHSGLEATLAKTVCERFPAIELVRFVNSGTEANMMALATAIAYTGDGKKKKVLVFNKGYHGSTISGRTPSGKMSINLPHEFVVGTYNDEVGVAELLKALPKDTLAAILVEPMLGSGGCFRASVPFMQTLRKIADEQNALLIFDEVMTSRLGYHGLGNEFEKDGVRPDMVTLGKWVGGGMSFGAFGGRREIMELYDPRGGQLEHPGTFNNNVFSMSAGIAGCALLSEEVLGVLNGRGTKLQERLGDVLKKHRILGMAEKGDVAMPDRPLTDALHEEESARQYPKMFVTGMGSLMTVHFIGPERTLLQPLFFHWMLNQGVYLAQRGFMALNIELKDEHMDKYVEAVDAFCEKHGDFLRWQ